MRVVYIGVDHASAAMPLPTPAPGGSSALGERPMLLCLGTDFRHKNRVFALRLLEALRDGHGWDGTLVLAGPRVSAGSSAGEEAAYLATRPELAERVVVAAGGQRGREGMAARSLRRGRCTRPPTRASG